jgi:hypothetical protein
MDVVFTVADTVLPDNLISLPVIAYVEVKTNYQTSLPNLNTNYIQTVTVV